MDPYSLLPLLYYAIASGLTTFGLRQRRQIRVLLLVPVWSLSLLALASSHRLSWLIGADSTFASLLVFYLLYSAQILVFETHGISPEARATNKEWSPTFLDCYRTWNNPRHLPIRLSNSRLDRQTTSSDISLNNLTRFAFTKLAKAAALWSFEHFIFQRIFIRALGRVLIADFSPETELLHMQLSSHQVQVRAIMSVQWIWRAYFFLEFYHSLLAIVFVAILRFDCPDEWPGLFGSPSNAYSVRKFWGRFWHQLTIPTYIFYGRFASKQILGLQPGSSLEKTAIAFFVFTISGLSHSLVGWALGDAALFRDILFFEICFFAAACETLFHKSLRRASKILAQTFVLPSLVRRVVGMVWVFVFFFCVSPLWIYPKIYHALLHPVS
ncbi:membrane bound O-acyl transferase family-domain-containing protein [Aspergillus karnatakaensis]|uniref:wax synthase family protein n=1 Tax=Aspergillus karnatakaensis TaxID=1810916 RepID=UPI003CCD86D4